MPEIYVYLMDEGTSVWRPVRAVRVNANTYRILQQPYDTDDEKWEFPPGSIVKVRE